MVGAADETPSAFMAPAPVQPTAIASVAATEEISEAPEPTKGGQSALVLLCLCAALEGADTMLLRAVFFALQLDLGLSLSDVATITLFQAAFQALSAPFWSILADRGILRRKTILVLGSVLQGVVTAGLASVSSVPSMIVLRSLNGVMLASLRPIINGIVADATSESSRGNVYGWIQFSVNVGMVLISVVATPLSTCVVAGVQGGWRLAHLGVGAVSVAVGVVVALGMTEPEHRRAAGEGRGAAIEELRRLLRYLRMPTFCILVIQGCFGCIPWNALSYQTLFFQVGGLSGFQASMLQSINLCAGALGGLLGGVLADRCARRCPSHGRVVVAQISVFAGIPVAWLIFMVPTPQVGAFVWYLALMVTLGLTTTWCMPGVNLPILSEVVSEGRSAIMAWQGALEGSCGAIFGNAAVGVLAEHVFGYDLQKAGAENPDNLHALGEALMWTSLLPWLVCLAFYSLLHWSYPRDLRRLRAKSEAERTLAKGNDAGVEPKLEEASLAS